MRDSRIGAMGVVALLLVVLLKVACLAALAPRARITAVLLMPLAGRCAILAMMALLPYARASSGGLASLFYHREVRTAAGCSLLLLAAVAWLTGGGRAIVALVATAVIVLLFSFYCRKKIGGATGDTLGAVCELAETGISLVFVSRYDGVAKRPNCGIWVFFATHRP